jgi:hypothetical protein
MKRVSIEIDDDLYQELVKRGGGPRKVSAPANELIRVGIEAERRAADLPNALGLAVSRKQFQEMQDRIAALEAAEAARRRAAQGEGATED